jgi:hypothetical protein
MAFQPTYVEVYLLVEHESVHRSIIRALLRSIGWSTASSPRGLDL